MEEWLWYVKLTPTYNFYIPFSLNDESFFVIHGFFYFENFLFLCVLCVNHKFRYNCFICLFSRSCPCTRDGEERKKSCEKKEKTEHELQPNLVKNFLSISSHDIESSLSHVLVSLLSQFLSPTYSLVFFHLNLQTKNFLTQFSRSQCHHHLETWRHDLHSTLFLFHQKSLNWNVQCRSWFRRKYNANWIQIVL